MNPVIIAHGGIEFGLHSGFTANEKQTALKNAVIHGYAILRVGNSSVDAVEATIKILEDNEHFNAGYGAVLNADGEVELDAGIMNGTGLKVGSVGAVKDIEHPITLAKCVMQLTEHSLLVGEGAQICTVGVVAIDTDGKCTVGTSSGGGFNKMPGRVGSSAIVGAGFYADSSIGGSVATGHGESMMKSCLCFSLVDQMRVKQLRGELPMLAVKNVVESATKESKNCIGVIALDRQGEFGVAFSAPRMPWAYCRHGELRFGAESGENFEEHL